MVCCNDAQVFVCQSLKAKPLSLTYYFRMMLYYWLSSVTALVHTVTATRHRKYRNGHQKGGFIFAFHPCSHLGSLLCRFPCHC